LSVMLACGVMIVIMAGIMLLRRRTVQASLAVQENKAADSAISAAVVNTKPAQINEKNIHDYISAIDHDWRHLMPNKDITFTVFCDPRIIHPLALNTDALNHIIHTLIGRAYSTTKSGRIHMHVTEKHNSNDTEMPQMEIVIADTGTGLIASKSRALDGLEYDFNVSQMTPYIDDISARLIHKSRLDCGAEFILTCPFASGETNEQDELPAAPAEVMIELKLEDDDASNTEDAIADSMKHALDSLVPRVIDRPETSRGELNKKALIQELSGLSALVVEDIQSNRNAIRALLNPLDPKLIYAASGREAINALKTHLFDYIIMDIHMPGLSGIETAEIIRAREIGEFHVPIVSLTADSTADTYERALMAGIDIVLTKPVTGDALFKAIYMSRKAHPNYQSYTKSVRIQAMN